MFILINLVSYLFIVLKVELGKVVLLFKIFLIIAIDIILSVDSFYTINSGKSIIS